jgi:membrane AbrB-like protein
VRQIVSSLAVVLPSRKKALIALETLAIGTAGGLLFLWANLPGGLISGAMVSTGIAAICGRQLAVPPLITQGVLVVLGISLGSVVSRQLIDHISAYPVTIALLAAATFCSTFASSYYLQRLHGWDRTSAFLAGSPGALSQITILAVERGADLPAIAVVQTMRVIILTAALPMVLALTGVAPANSPGLVLPVASPMHLVALVAASLALSLILRILKFPASWMFGAMIASSVLHGAGLVDGGLPPWVRLVALVGIGSLIGDLRHLCRDHRAHHPGARVGRDRGFRTRRNGRHAGAGSDPAHRPDLRRRASHLALHLRHHRHPRHRPSVRTNAGRR